MNTLLELLLQYGIAGVALFMLYSILTNHLKTIQTTLMRVEVTGNASLKVLKQILEELEGRNLS